MNWDTAGTFLFHFLTYGIFLYSFVLLLSYILIAIYSVGETRRYMWKNSFTDYRVLATSVHAPSVSILAPAYNEGKTIVDNVRSLLSIYYANLEVIIINDGSKDDSLEKLIQAYDLEMTDYFVNEQLATKAIRGIYKSRNSIYNKLIVVDKENGGKADALNVGINVSSNDYLVCIDVDCILEQDALLKMVKPFLEQTDRRVIATGGVVRIANSCVIEDGRLIKVKLAEDYLPRIQILEYIRAFILGRMAWSRLNGLMLISGAFGAFDKEIAIRCGGYNHNTVGEDMELVVRMRRYMEERNEKYAVTYIPDPLCWTEAPATFKILGRQRNRWIRGTFETLMMHKRMFFNPRYGLLGMLSYPYWFFFELCAPLIEFFGIVCFLVFVWNGFIAWDLFFSFFLFIVCFGYLYSSFAILMEVFTFNQYKRRIDILRLLLTGMTEPFYYHPFVVWSAIKGFWDLLKKKKGWGEMTRQGFAQKKNGTAPQAVPATAAVTPAAVTTVTVAAAPEAQAGPEPEWFVQRTIIPVISRFIGFVGRSLNYYINHIIILLLLLICARGFELVYEMTQHGVPRFVGKVVLMGFAKDLVFFLQIGASGYLLFALLFLIHKKLAHFFFVTVSVILLLLQVLLSEYFVTTLLPLGADLWSYSVADINQTLSASGGIKPSIIVLLLATVSLVIAGFIFFLKSNKARGWTVFIFFAAFIAVTFTNGPKLVNDWTPGQEHSNNIALNKSRYFLEATYRYFFPPAQELDIYSDHYSETVAPPSEEAGRFSFKYIDEANYPFLHEVDSTRDVLSPFFTPSRTPPNIVVILVEGLGRAFSNKGAYLGSFTPFMDSLSEKGLYWENFISEGGRTFAVLPSLLSSLPFELNGFNDLGEAMPEHLSLLNLAKKNGYHTSFYYGGDARFDNMDIFLKKNRIDVLNDERSFPAGYTKMPAQDGFCWGYGDKELFRRFLDRQADKQQPYLSVLLTLSTHNPFLINEQEKYLQRFENRMNVLGLSEGEKAEKRNYKNQFASILYADDAVRDLITAYRKRPGFENTVFLITGDHRMPEIPMSTKIDRYHVPLILYSPLLKRTAKFSSVSTHFDVAPTLTAWLRKSYGLRIPNQVSWLGAGLDTAHQFRNLHAYPLMQTKNEVADFVKGDYLLSGDQLFRISSNLDLSPETNEVKKAELQAAFNRFRAKNHQVIKTQKIVPDSVLQRYIR